MQQIRRIILILILVTGYGKSFGQDESDVLLWSSIGFEYEPTDNWSFEIEGNYRLKDNISVMDEYFGEFGAYRKILKGLWIGAALRYIWENDNIGNVQGIENHLRYQVETTYQFKPGAFAVKFRFRYQNKNELGVDDVATERVRFKTRIRYNIRDWKLDPEVSYELFSRNLSKNGNLIKSYRLKIGTDYKIKNIGKIGVYYGIQPNLEKLNSETFHILGLKYTYTLKGK